MLKKINYALAGLTLLAYTSIYIPTEKLWFSNIISWSIFGFIIIHIVLTIFWSLTPSPNVFISLLTLLLGFKFLMITFAFNPKRSSAKATFSVLSYNARAFNIYEDANYTTGIKDLTTNLMKTEAAIFCLQEYYQQNEGENKINVAHIFAAQNYWTCTALPTFNKKGGRFGLAIFSKYPILKHDFIHYEIQSEHGFLYADIKIGTDTLRFYNVHFKSWRRKSEADFWSHFKSISLKHNSELKVLLKHIEMSPYEVILAGDFNAPPYSQVYFQLSELLENAFEVGGRGLGFTYHSDFPCLRIDHIFHAPNLVLEEFKIWDTMNLSDHFPIQAYYSKR